MKYATTGLGIRSSDPRFWMPDPAKSVIMSKSRLHGFLKGHSHPTPTTHYYSRDVADHVGVTGAILPSRRDD
jgi:hypothetical protein